MLSFASANNKYFYKHGIYQILDKYPQFTCINVKVLLFISITTETVNHDGC